MDRVNTSLPKSFARLVAVQMLYAFSLDSEYYNFDENNFHELSENQIIELLPDFKLHSLGEEVSVRKTDNKFIRAALLHITRHMNAIDETIRSFLHRQNSFESLDTLVRSILRIASYELNENAETDQKIIISQYVLIAEAFYPKNEVYFVNAIVDKIAAAVKERERLLSEQQFDQD